MFVIGLTGGIGSGKSTVAELLARRGAVVVDADLLAREAIAPGTDGFREVVEAFGPQVVGPDGAIDREALARIVFEDSQARRRLEAIVWPKVGERIAARLAELASTDAVVVLDVPLLVESGSARGMVQAVVVVTAPEEVRLRRLAERGMDPSEARRRMRAQAPDAERLAAADYVIRNDGSLAALEAQVEEVWRKVTA